MVWESGRAPTVAGDIHFCALVALVRRLGGQIKIVAEPDFADVLPEMHLRSAWFSCQHSAHPSFVDSSDVGSTCTNRLKFSFNCN